MDDKGLMGTGEWFVDLRDAWPGIWLFKRTKCKVSRAFADSCFKQ